jgi:hypothetical protein
MAVLSVMSIQGNPDELLARMEATLDPVAARKAPQYGGISSTVVRTDDGIKILNLWETEEGRHRMADDPEIQDAVRAAGFPKPNFKGYEVLTIRSAAEGTRTSHRRRGLDAGQARRDRRGDRARLRRLQPDRR